MDDKERNYRKAVNQELGRFVSDLPEKEADIRTKHQKRGTIGALREDLINFYIDNFDSELAIIYKNCKNIWLDGIIDSEEKKGIIEKELHLRLSVEIKNHKESINSDRSWSTQDKKDMIEKIESSMNFSIQEYESNIEIEFLQSKKLDKQFKLSKRIFSNRNLTIYGLLLTCIIVYIAIKQLSEDKGKLKVEYVQFIEGVNDNRLSQESGIQIKITNIGQRSVFTDYLISEDSKRELYRWQKDRKVEEGGTFNFYITLGHSSFWLLKKVEKLYMIDTKKNKYYLNQVSVKKIRNKVISLYKKWKLPESHNVDDNEYFILKDAKENSTE